MRSLLILFSLITFSLNAGAARLNPEDQFIKITDPSAEAIYNALTEDNSHLAATAGNPNAKVLLNGRLKCIKFSKIAGGGYNCFLAKNLEPFELEHIFRHLDTAPIATSDFRRNVKILGEIIFVSQYYEADPALSPEPPSTDNNKIFLNHPCKNIETLAAAKKCMQFWAQDVFQNYDEANAFHTTESNRWTQLMLSEVMFAYGATRRVLNKAFEGARSAPYLGILATFGDPIEVFYFALDNQKIMRPIELYSIRISDTDPARVENLYGEQGMAKHDAFSSFACSVLLGGKAHSGNGLNIVIDEIKQRFFR